MTIVAADPTLQAEFSRATGRSEIRDRDGNLLGFFTPRKIEEDLAYQRSAAHFSEDETQRRLATEKQGCTTEEVMRFLRSLESR